MTISAVRYRCALLLLTACIILFIGLMLWQIARAIQKQAMIDDFAARVDMPVVTDVSAWHEALFFRRAALTGSYMPDTQLLLDNQWFDDKLGYNVFTPLVMNTPQGQGVVLVNRGWIAAPVDRQVLSLPVSENTQTVSGQIFPLPRILAMGAVTVDNNWPRIVQRIDTAVIAQWFAMPVMPFVLALSPDMADGYARDWYLSVAIPPQRHIAYAVTWAIFALISIGAIIMLWRNNK